MLFTVSQLRFNLTELHCSFLAAFPSALTTNVPQQNFACNTLLNLYLSATYLAEFSMYGKTVLSFMLRRSRSFCGMKIKFHPYK